MILPIVILTFPYDQYSNAITYINSTEKTQLLDIDKALISNSILFSVIFVAPSRVN